MSDVAGKDALESRIKIPSINKLLGMKTINVINKVLYGHDIFISYSRYDGLDYSYRLAEYFISKGYDCYIDQIRSTTPGKNLPSNIVRALKRSASLVIVGSEGAKESKPVQKEIETFLSVKKNSPIIAININDAIKQSIWYSAIEGLPLIQENKEALLNNRPSDEIVTRILNSLNFTKKSKRLRNVSAGVLLVTLLLSGFLFFEVKAIGKAELKIKEAQAELDKKNIQLEQSQNFLAQAKDSETKAREQILLLGKEKHDLDIQAGKLNAENLKLGTENNTAKKNLKDELAKLTIAKNEVDTARKEISAMQIGERAITMGEKDPTEATKLALNSYAQYKNIPAENMLLKIYNSDDMFYRRKFDHLGSVVVSKTGLIAGIDMVNGKLLIYDKNQDEKKVADVNEFFRSVTFIGKDSLICAVGKESVCIFDLNGNLKEQNKISDTYWSAIIKYIEQEDLTVIVTGSSDVYFLYPGSGRPVKIDLGSGKRLAGEIFSISYNEIAKQLLITSRYGIVYQLNTKGIFLKEKEIGCRRENGYKVIDESYIIAKGKYLVVLSEDTLITYDANTLNEVLIEADIAKTTVSCDGKYFMKIAKRNFVFLENVDSLLSRTYSPAGLPWFEGEVQDVSISADDQYVAISEKSGYVAIYNLKGNKVASCRAHIQNEDKLYPEKNLLWIPGSAGLITFGFADTTAIYWDMNSRRNVFVNRVYADHSHAFGSKRSLICEGQYLHDPDGGQIVFTDLNGKGVDSLKIGEGSAAEFSIDKITFSNDNNYVKCIYHLPKKNREDSLIYDLNSRSTVKDIGDSFFQRSNHTPNSKWTISTSMLRTGNKQIILTDKEKNMLLFNSGSQWEQDADRVSSTDSEVFLLGMQGVDLFLINPETAAGRLKKILFPMD